MKLKEHGYYIIGGEGFDAYVIGWDATRSGAIRRAEEKMEYYQGKWRVPAVYAASDCKLGATWDGDCEIMPKVTARAQ